MNRWFSGQVAIPQGVLSWVYDGKLLPYARRLASTLTLAGTNTDIREVGGRIVFSGVPRGRPPSRVVLPCCRPMSLRSLLAGMNKRLNSKNEGETLFWIEYLSSHSDDLPAELQRHARLRDLTR